MPANEETYDLNTSALEAKLDRIANRMREIQRLANGGNSAVSPELARSGMVGSPASASNVQATASSSVSGSPEAIAIYNQAIAKYPGLGAGAYEQIRQQLGIGAPTSTGVNATAGISNVLSTAQISANYTRTLALPTQVIGVGGGNPIIGPTMQMPAWAAPFQMPAYGTANATPVMAPAGQIGFGGYPSPVSLGGRGMAVAGVAVNGASQFLSLSAQQTISGGPNIMGNARATGELIGGLLGAFGGPATAIGGALIGGPAMEWLAAPMERDRQVMANVFNVSGAFPMDLNRIVGSQGWAAQRADAFRAGSNVRTFSAAAVGAMYSTAISALFTGGLDPMSDAGYNPMFRSPLQPGERERRGGAGGLIAGLARTALNGIRYAQDLEFGRENLAQAVVRRVGVRYPDESAATEVMNRIAPIYGDLPSSGGNIADILVAHGPLDTFRFLQSQVEPGMPEAVPRDDLRRVSEAYRRGGRELSFAGLQVRGAGRMTELAARRQMATLSALPGGRDSLAYMEAFTTARAGSMQQFQDDITTRFGIPQVGLNEEIARARFRPYAPGEVFGAQVGLIRSQLGEARAIESFISRRGAAGELGVDEEYSLRSRAASSRIAAFDSLSSIAMGAQNLLPGIAATGAFGAGLRRFTGMQQAATYLNPYAFFRRDAGFMGGRASNHADEFLAGFGIPATPHSRSAEVNNPYGGASDGILRQILAELQKLNARGSGSFQRPDRGAGDLNSQTGPRGWGGP